MICFFLQVAKGSFFSRWIYGASSKPNLQHTEVPLVDILPLPVSTDCDLALSSPGGAMAQGSGAQADPELINTIIEGVSRDNPPPPD